MPHDKHHKLERDVLVKTPMHYDVNFKSIVGAVEKQLKLRIRIPAQFREYGIRVIERWHRDDVKWLNGRTLKFCDPHAD